MAEQAFVCKRAYSLWAVGVEEVIFFIWRKCLSGFFIVCDYDNINNLRSDYIIIK